MNLLWPLFLLVAVAGAFTAVQAPTNALLARAAGSPLNAALISFGVGTLALAGVVVAFGARFDLPALRALPWHAWLGGLYGAAFVSLAAYAVPRLGVAPTLVLVVAGQLASSLLIDHLGAFGVPRSPVSLGRAVGVLLVLAGVILVQRR